MARRFDASRRACGDPRRDGGRRAERLEVVRARMARQSGQDSLNRETYFQTSTDGAIHACDLVAVRNADRPYHPSNAVCSLIVTNQRSEPWVSEEALYFG